MEERLGIISDTHGNLRAWQAALAVWGEVDMILHAGDVLYHGPKNPLPEGYGPRELAEAMNASPVPLLFAQGNCDAEEDARVLRWPLDTRTAVLWWRGMLVLMRHGENFSAFRDLALRCGARLAVSGHTHVGSVVREEGTIFLNPGSASLPKGRDPASCAIADGEGISILTLEGTLLHHEPWNL
jgi:putative phosphoesterase